MKKETVHPKKSSVDSTIDEKCAVVFENKLMRLEISRDGMARSLVYKPTGAECLATGNSAAISTVTEPRPYQNEIKLSYPCQRTVFSSNAVRLEEGKLIIGYELIPWEAVVSVKATGDYIAFTLEGMRLTEAYGIAMTEPPVSEIQFLRLPVRELGHWGDWLNVVWDEEVAINLLAADPSTMVDGQACGDFRILQAGADAQVCLGGVTAALIICPPCELLDKIAILEEDYGLPRGVASRRHPLYNASYYWTDSVNPANVDEHISMAKAGGFRLMSIYYPAFLESRQGYRLIGNYDVFRSEYPNGKADLKAMLDRVKAAGITPGCHFLHSHIGRSSRYVTPVPDHRLNLLRVFTLSRPLGEEESTIYVEQNPASSTMANNRRVLKIGNELVSYEGYTTTPPYTFHGCLRGIDGTTPGTHPMGFMFGLLDVSEFGATSVYIDQNSSLQDEVADEIANIWNAGFQFFYFDGSEGVNPPFWHHVANAQYRVFRKLCPQPILAEGAAKTHFSWHMLAGGNAFDVFKPERIKEETIRHPLREAPRMRDNFTRLNFGWLGYFLPGEKTTGTQPDQLEFVTSKAAAWDCPVSLHASPETLKKHPRTADNLEVIRRWEVVRGSKWLGEKQKQMLRDPRQEFILLLNNHDEFELVSCDQMKRIAGGCREIIAHVFERRQALYVVYNHISADARLELPIKSDDLRVLESIDANGTPPETIGSGLCVVPVGKRRYLKTGLSRRSELLDAFAKARLLP